ncbi:DUF6096 family protein [Feifania hominis]|uniref:Uncharacterized protein n=1 Tax=Feifania hominis TaxID=2763660 RepID=A0A926DDC9_9FIRM|nr:DUF6096 family protein [Feifania hominis]MBC8536890.1 hypothetical protein [Feifania hominis]
MTRFVTLQVGGEEYRLRLTAEAILAAEKKLDKSIITALQTIQENLLGTVTVILWAAMQPLQPGTTMERVYEIYDDYIDGGHTVEELLAVITELFEVSGFFKRGQA